MTALVSVGSIMCSLEMTTSGPLPDAAIRREAEKGSERSADEASPPNGPRIARNGPAKTANEQKGAKGNGLCELQREWAPDERQEGRRQTARAQERHAAR